jgi:phosphoribosyl 1,2-cyclic phosphodiesterase
MASRFAMLASGSSGNACLLEINGFGLLIDVGLGPRQLAARLADVGASWAKIHAVLLTHTHTDHWKDRTFEHLRQKKIPVYCHPEHHESLLTYSSTFPKLRDAGLVRSYERDGVWAVNDTLRCHALELCHDSTPTFGFRLEGTDGLFGTGWSIGYVADLGCWSAELVEALLDVDVLALEFNHDEEMERESGRSIQLIKRVLGDSGHLSNGQAGQFLHAILTRSQQGAVRHLVQLHLSRECNRPHLAQGAARAVLDKLCLDVPIHTARNDRAGPNLTLDPHSRPTRRAAASASRATKGNRNPEQLLPGMS